MGCEPVSLVVNGVEDCIEPIKGCLQVKVIPETMTENECVGFGRLLGGKEGAKTRELFWSDREADHLLDYGYDLSNPGRKVPSEDDRKGQTRL